MGRLWIYPGNGAGGVVGRTLVSTGWNGITAMVTSGNRDHHSGNDLLTRDSAGHLWMYPGDNDCHFASPHQIGRGWNGMTFIG